MIEIDVKQEDKVTIVELHGRLDSEGARKVRDELMPVAEAGSRVLLDMSDVDYMSSAGLRVLLMFYRKVDATAGAIVMTGLNQRIRDVMEMTGFLDFFSTSETREEALQALKS